MPPRSPLAGGKTFDEVALERFLKGVRKLESGCWICEGSTFTGKGYTEIKLGHSGRLGRKKCHVISYEHFIGSVPKGMLVCHTCDNPVCVNPDHLFIGTNKDNLADMAEKDRSCHGIKHRACKLTEPDVMQIYKLGDSGLALKEIGERFGITESNVHYILKGKSWKRLYAQRAVSDRA